MIALLLLGTLPAAAQLPGVRLEWGVIGGVNVPDFTTDMDRTEVKNKLGWQVGMVTAVKVGIIAIEPQILYVRQGLRIRPEGGREITSESRSLDKQEDVSQRLHKPQRIADAQVFTVMNDCKQKSGGDLVDFGRVRPPLSYSVGAGVKLLRHLLVDVRFNGQFRAKHDVVLPDGARLDKLRSYNVALSLGYLF